MNDFPSGKIECLSQKNSANTSISSPSYMYICSILSPVSKLTTAYKFAIKNSKKYK